VHLFSTASRLAAHYSSEDGHYLIELRLREVRGLFNSLDPAPFIEKDLDDDAESYIINTVKDFPLAAPLKLVIYLPAKACESEDAASIPEAVRNYFDYRAHHADRASRACLIAYCPDSKDHTFCYTHISNRRSNGSNIFSFR